MIVTLTEPRIDSPRRLRLTRADRSILQINGLLDLEKFELIEGDLIEKMPKKPLHVHVLLMLQNWLAQTFGFRYVLQESPMNVSLEDSPTNEPEPDLLVMNRPSEIDNLNAPLPHEVRLVVEVSDSTLRFDMTVKAALYARASIPEYWVLDVKERRMAVHQDPQAGNYQSVLWLAQNESVSPLAAPGASFSVAEAFN